MIYKFNIGDKPNHRLMKLYKKTNKINFMMSHEGTIKTALSVSIFLVLSLFNNYSPLFDGHIFLKIALSIILSLFIFSIFQLSFNEPNVYKKLSKELECSAFIKKISLLFSENDEKIDNAIIPSFQIQYDVNNTAGKVAALIRVSPEQFKIIALLDNKSVEKNKLFSVSSNKVKNAINEAMNNLHGDIYSLVVCEINSDKMENDYVTADDIDLKFITTESFIIKN